MPSEIRHILFQPAEVVQALKHYRFRMGQPLPPGSITFARPDPNAQNDPVSFRFFIQPDAGGSSARQEFVFDGPTLAAALILSCKDLRIPLPIHADKSLQRFGEQIGLVATYNPRQDALPGLQQIRA